MLKTFAAAVLTIGLGACASIDGASTVAKFDSGILVNSAGMTLYTFDKDPHSSGKSMCNVPCAMKWPPLHAADSDTVSGDWSVIMRNDGSRQMAYKGKPLYLWAKDRKPGDKTGDGFKNVWHVVTSES
jgi:predicted lipoprotein with Yx(FWY)xxD motif